MTTLRVLEALDVIEHVGSCLVSRSLARCSFGVPIVIRSERIGDADHRDEALQKSARRSEFCAEPARPSECGITGTAAPQLSGLTKIPIGAIIAVMTVGGPVHFLHVRKTGGMAIKAALADIAAEFNIILHGHGTSLADIPLSERVFFTIRDPVSRFVSGFNSRLRMGRPLLNSVWNDGETKAFAMFKTPNELAEALSSNDEQTHADAMFAMREIRHINQYLNAWFPSEERVRAHMRQIVWIAFTETLLPDFEEIKRRLRLPQDVSLPGDDVKSHRTPAGLATELSALGRSNVERWFADDKRLVDFLRRMRTLTLAYTGDSPQRA